MLPDQTAALQALAQAQQAFKRGEKRLARHYAEQALHLAPELEDAWLLMAALATPRGSLAFLERALQINPQSERARKGLVWAGNRLREQSSRSITALEKTVPTAPKMVEATVPVADRAQNAKTAPQRTKKPGSGSRSVLVALIIVLCLATAGILLMNPTPVAAFINNNLLLGAENSPVLADTATFTNTPVPTATATFTPVFTATASPTGTSPATHTETPTETPSLTPTDLPTEAASPTLLPTDTAAPEPTQDSRPLPTAPSSVSGGVHWIDVDLTNQMVYAYEGKTIVNSFLVSTGTSQHRTITGSYHIYEKHLTANMWGPGYFLPDVPYTMYFHKGYALHGTYWHSNFGTPMSHGCVNLSTPDAEWLYSFATIGTLVRVHY